MSTHSRANNYSRDRQIHSPAISQRFWAIPFLAVFARLAKAFDRNTNCKQTDLAFTSYLSNGTHKQTVGDSFIDSTTEDPSEEDPVGEVI